MAKKTTTLKPKKSKGVINSATTRLEIYIPSNKKHLIDKLPGTSRSTVILDLIETWLYSDERPKTLFEDQQIKRLIRALRNIESEEDRKRALQRALKTIKNPVVEDLQIRLFLETLRKLNTHNRTVLQNLVTFCRLLSPQNREEALKLLKKRFPGRRPGNSAQKH
jgi:hypothetical protein